MTAGTECVSVLNFSSQTKSRKMPVANYPHSAFCSSPPSSSIIRPPDICRRTYILPAILLLSSSFFFRRLISQLAERNWTKIGHILESNCSLKTHVEYLRYPPTNRGPKNHLFGRLRNLMAISTAYIFRAEHDIDNRSSTVKCVDNYKRSPTLSQHVVNFGPQTASNWKWVFTHPP